MQPFSLPPLSDLLWIALLLTLLAALAVALQKLDFMGALSGIFIGLLLYAAMYGSGLWLLGTLFALGTAASEWRKKEKQTAGLRQADEGRRNWRNVWGNAGAAAAWTLIGWATGTDAVLPAAATLIAATSDTVASEVGNVLGSRYVSILNWQKGVRGEDGTISLEGTLASLVAAALAAGVFWCSSPIATGSTLLLLTVSGFAGCLLDSLLGATLQKKQVLNNHSVNLFSTFLAGSICWVLMR